MRRTTWTLVWLAAVLLPLQTLPAVACGCTTMGHAGHHSALEPPVDPAVSEGTKCCDHPKVVTCCASTKGFDTCDSHASKQTAAVCTCSHNHMPPPHSAAVTAPGTTDVGQFAPPQSSLATPSPSPSPSMVSLGQPPTTTTALERCVLLARLTL